MKTIATPFNPVTKELIDELRRAVGEDCVHVDEDTLSVCASDETEDLVFRPDVVVEPRNSDGVAAAMRLASRHRVPVTPRGAGTGLSGGALPVHGGIVLTTRNLNRILEIDRTNLMAVVETVRSGDPFVPENAVRLKTIAWCVLATQLLNLAYGMLAAAMNAAGSNIEWKFSLTGWLAVVLLFVLARVFEEGTQMRDDLEKMI